MIKRLIASYRAWKRKRVERGWWEMEREVLVLLRNLNPGRGLSESDIFIDTEARGMAEIRQILHNLRWRREVPYIIEFRDGVLEKWRTTPEGRAALQVGGRYYEAEDCPPD